ncbi:MAG: HlyD family efflux transporter periplasmic adaptor subunit [Hyphomicrobiaceae bacterium]|nr:HlyD family efflux transporter periplasmic adaptor subunit [Hyphomicrobiaceae bacterium]
MAVKVKRERPDQRRHHRITAPLFVDVLGWRMRAADWSLGGLRLKGFPDHLPEVGVEIPLHLHLPFQGFDVSFEVKAEVVRQEPATQTFAVRFTEVGERERELMSHFIEELVRGSMSHVQDTIQRIDVPVTPASLKPDPNPVAEVPTRRWPVRTVVMSSVYLLLGVLVFGYTGLLMYTNFYKLEVQTAVINAPVEAVHSQVDGRVEVTGVTVGSPVRRGQVVADVNDNKLEREIDLARIAVSAQKAKLTFLKQRHLDELEKAQSFATLEMKGVRQAKLSLESLRAQQDAQRRQVERFRVLHKQGYVTDARLEAAEKELVRLQKAVESGAVELKSRAAVAKLNLGRRMYTGDRIVGEVDQIAAQVRLAEKEIELAKQRYEALVKQRKQLLVRAPFDGTVLLLPKEHADVVRKGDVIAIFEKRAERHVLAYLTQEEVLRIGLGDKATVFVPALRVTLKARVVKVDRTSGFVREQDLRHNPAFSWRGPSDRSAKVVLAFDNQDKVKRSKVFQSGLPVVVVFERRATNGMLTAVSRRLSVFE